METRRRRRPNRKTSNSRKLLIAGCVIGAVALIAAACFFLAGGGTEDDKIAYDPDRGPLKELTVNSFTRRGEVMVVDTSYLKAEFPYAFSDLIQVETLNHGNQTALAFTARIDNEDKPLYTIWFNGSKGEAVGTMDLQDGGKPVVVTLVFYTPDAELTGDGLTTFYATQETVNDVLASLNKDTHYTQFE